MRVFVAGATGAIGGPLIAALVAASHDVMGMTTSVRNIDMLRAAGAGGVVANALDAPEVHAAIKKFQPDVVIDELTSLPRRYTPEEMRAAAGRDRTLRLEGGRNLQNAAIAAGARRYIVQSSGFFHAPGPGLATETDALAVNASPAVAASARTYTQIEDRVLGTNVMEGLALRYGFFYGPGTWFTESGAMADQVRARGYPVAGPGDGVWSWVHVADAAVATVAALTAAPGIYNIVDDDPSPMSIWLPAFAIAMNAPPPPHLSEQEALATVGADFVYYANRLRGASNAKARRSLSFAPRRLEWFATKAKFSTT